MTPRHQLPDQLPDPSTEHPAGRHADRVLDGLVARGVLTADQAHEVAAALASPPLLATAPGTPPPPAARPPTHERTARSGLAEVAGYLGGALVAGAAALFLFGSWSALTTSGRVTSLVGTAGVLALAGAALTRRVRPADLRSGRDPARRRLVSTLWGFAALALGGAAGVAADAAAERGLAAGVLTGGAVALVAAAAAYVVVPGLPGHVAAWVGAVTPWTGLIDLSGLDDGQVALGGCYIAVGVLWAGLAVRGVLREPTAGGVLAMTTALIGAQSPLVGPTEQAAYLFTAAVAVAGFVAYLRLRAWPYLAGAVAATTLVVPEAVHDAAGDDLSTSGVLLVAGVTLLVASAAGLRVRTQAEASSASRRRFTSGPPR
jgi:hypothetical protein